MSKRYFYYTDNFIVDNLFDAVEIMKGKFCIIIECVISKKSNIKVCLYENEFIEVCSPGDCNSNDCFQYEPRNGKNGICVHRSYGLIETGRKWHKLKDGTIKKISSRRKIK